MSFAFNKYMYLISIDLGTTYSGSCFAITGGLTDTELRGKNNYDLVENTNLYSNEVVDNKKEILRPVDLHVVGHAAFQSQNMNKSKVPTVVIYDQFRQLSYWGYEAVQKLKGGHLSPYDKIVDKFILKLPKSINQKGSFQKYEATDISSVNDNLRATIDYFKVLYGHTYDFIQNHRYGNDYPIGQIRFVITVPDIWNNVERAVMRQVTIQAGLISEEDHENRLLIINESLAVTLYAEREIADQAISIGDKYIICDAGGSTVKITTFIKTDTQAENISFGRCQLTADSSDKCGSTFLDANMGKLLSKVLYGEDIFKYDDRQKDRPKEDQNELKEKRKEIEIFLKRFIGIEEDDCLKNNFGDGMSVYITDEEYFQKHKEDFDKLMDQATIFKDFPDIELIDNPDFEFTNSNEFKFSHEDEDEDFEYLNIKYYINKDGIYLSDEYELIIPFEVMVKHVFGPIVEIMLELLERQIKKVDGYVTYIFLIGGLGRSLYLKRRIEQVFKDRVDIVVAAPFGEEAAMRGAAYYGVDGSKRPIQTDFNDVSYNENFNAEYYNTVICIDVGYDHTSCSYVNLNHQNSNEETTKEVKDWPGLNDRNAVNIPTAYDKDNNTWGATVSNIADVDPTKFIVPNRFMSVVKDDLRRFLVNFLRQVHKHALQYIAKEEGKTDTSRFRYCITLENSYKYFNKKQDMRRIAVEANIIPIDHDPKRLLLIKREDAAAMHFENQHLELKKYIYFLQIFIRHDSCHLSLEEAIKIAGFDVSPRKEYFRNVRGIRSATLEFDFVAKLVANLDLYISKYPSIRCTNNHTDYYSSYYSELREGFLNFVKEKLDFNQSDHKQEFPIRKSGCCMISISVYDLLEHIFRPAFRDLISEINRHLIQANMDYFKLDKVFLADRLFQAKENTYKFLEKIFIKMLSDVIGLETTIIQPPEVINQAAVKGAVIYGRDPITYTERVARKTYFVTLEAFAIQEFDKNIKAQLIQESDLDKRYEIELKNAFRDRNQPIQLFYEPAQNPSRSYSVAPYYKNILIKRGGKITEADESNGIKRRFYSEKECIIYASIYTTEHDDIVYPEIGTTGIDKNPILDFETSQMIHQFEIYIKEDPDDVMNMFRSPRHYFEICMIPNNYEVKFEVDISCSPNNNIPEFRFRDEFLVANIYNDSQEIKLRKTTHE